MFFRFFIFIKNGQTVGMTVFFKWSESIPLTYIVISEFFLFLQFFLVKL